MTCPHCQSSTTRRRKERTSLGYRTFWCAPCRCRFNERTGSPFNELQCPTDVVLLAVLWRLRYKLSFRDVAELLLQRGYVVSHETVRVWELRFAPLVTRQLRAWRRGRADASWYLDEPYVKVAGRWCYLYRAVDRDGSLIDSMLSEHRDGMPHASPSGGSSRSRNAHPSVRPPTVTRPTRGRSARSPDGRRYTARRSISTTSPSRVTALSSSATTRCAASGTSPRHPASARPSTN